MPELSALLEILAKRFNAIVLLILLASGFVLYHATPALVDELLRPALKELRIKWLGPSILDADKLLPGKLKTEIGLAGELPGSDQNHAIHKKGWK